MINVVLKKKKKKKIIEISFYITFSMKKILYHLFHEKKKKINSPFP